MIPSYGERMFTSSSQGSFSERVAGATNNTMYFLPFGADLGSVWPKALQWWRQRLHCLWSCSNTHSQFHLPMSMPPSDILQAVPSMDFKSFSISCKFGWLWFKEWMTMYVTQLFTYWWSSRSVCKNLICSKTQLPCKRSSLLARPCSRTKI